MISFEFPICRHCRQPHDHRWHEQTINMGNTPSEHHFQKHIAVMLVYVVKVWVLTWWRQVVGTSDGSGSTQGYLLSDLPLLKSVLCVLSPIPLNVKSPYNTYIHTRRSVNVNEQTQHTLHTKHNTHVRWRAGRLQRTHAAVHTKLYAIMQATWTVTHGLIRRNLADVDTGHGYTGG